MLGNNGIVTKMSSSPYARFEPHPVKRGWGDLECDPDEGGQTSYYQGEVTGITQVVKLMHNLAAGRAPTEGLEHIPKDQRIFEFDDPEPFASRLRRLGRGLLHL